MKYVLRVFTQELSLSPPTKESPIYTAPFTIKQSALAKHISWLAICTMLIELFTDTLFTDTLRLRPVLPANDREHYGLAVPIGK